MSDYKIATLFIWKTIIMVFTIITFQIPYDAPMF